MTLARELMSESRQTCSAAADVDVGTHLPSNRLLRADDVYAFDREAWLDREREIIGLLDGHPSVQL